MPDPSTEVWSVFPLRDHTSLAKIAEDDFESQGWNEDNQNDIGIHVRLRV